MRFKLLIQRLRFLPTVTRTRPDTTMIIILVIMIIMICDWMVIIMINRMITKSIFNSPGTSG